MEPEEGAHRPSADDGDDPVDPLLCEPCKDVIGPIELLDLGVDDRANAKGIAAGGGTEDAPVAADQLLQVTWCERHQPAARIPIGKEQSVVSVLDAEDLPAQFTRGEHRARDDRVESGDVSAAEVDSDASGLLRH